MAESPRTLPSATPENLPRWRGFNLLEKFNAGGGNKPFVEQDFKLIAQWGFNFVRLPMDYRVWIKDGNWETFNEQALRDIDQAVEWGNKYGVHVCINFHRAPGYTVAKPAEKTDLFTDAETQRVCALHWGTFAKRYKGIPSSRLSFNLMNEPAKIDPKAYVVVVRKLVEAIRKEDPDRLIISDGLEWGGKPIPELKELRVAQATRGYAPMEISHYKAGWVKGDSYPEPAWPHPMKIPGTLVNPKSKKGNDMVMIDGPFVSATELRLHVQKVSLRAKLIVEADGNQVFSHAFVPGPGEGEWKTVEYVEKWKIYQNTYDKDYVAKIPAGTKQVKIHNNDGDWIHVSAIGLKVEGAKREDIVLTEGGWEKKPMPFKYTPGSPAGSFAELPMRDRQWLAKHVLEPWTKAKADGIGVFVGEWGAYNKTPHDITLRWAEDCLKNWKEANMGWALWNFRGSFGIINSGRTDVQYEDVEGLKLDRKLLELLQRY